MPDPISLPLGGATVLACGADLKNVIGVTRARELFLSQHIGDLEDWRAFDFSDTEIDVGPYPQIRQGQFGYIPSLSVIDLIFNCGPEAGAAVIASGARHFIETYGL